MSFIADPCQRHHEFNIHLLAYLRFCLMTGIISKLQCNVLRNL